MKTLRELYDAYIKDRLAWMTIRRDREEALFGAIVERIEALEAKRGPGRPPKVDEAA